MRAQPQIKRRPIPHVPEAHDRPGLASQGQRGDPGPVVASAFPAVRRGDGLTARQSAAPPSTENPGLF